MLTIKETFDGENEIEPYIHGQPQEVVNYHVQLLYQAGFIDVDPVETYDGITYPVRGLTWNGHEFLDAILPKPAWKKTLEQIRSHAGPLTVEIVKQWAINATTQS